MSARFDALPRARICAGAAILCAVAGLALRFHVLDRNRPFWMDESFTAALAVQDASTIIRICRKDVHPPLYFLIARAWNALLSPHAEAAEWRLLDFHVERIETMGLFDWARADRSDGAIVKTPGVFLDEPIFWSDMPLAPIAAMRCLSVLFGAGAGFLLWRLGRRIAPERPALALLAFAVFALSGYTLTWDTVIRSYSAGACLTAGIALVGFWGADTGRWRWAGPAIAALTATAFLLNYTVILTLPGLGLAIWIRAGLNRRAFVAVAISFLGGAALIAALWGRTFLEQTGRVPSLGWFALPLEQSFGASLDTVLLHYWRMLFADGVWVWLRNDPRSTLDPLRSLTPGNPALYAAAFALYGAAIVVNLWDFVKRPDRALAALAALALAPGLFVILGNTVNPGSFRIHARHLYPAAPFFYLFLARGWAAIGEKIRAMSGTHRRLRK